MLRHLPEIFLDCASSLFAYTTSKHLKDLEDNKLMFPLQNKACKYPKDYAYILLIQMPLLLTVLGVDYLNILTQFIKW